MGLGSGIRDPGSGKILFRIPDPGIKNAPDPGSATLDSRVHKTTYAPMIYTAQCVMVLMQADTLCGEVGGEFCGPQIPLAYRLVIFHRGPQNSRFPVPTPPPFPTLSIRPHQKAYARGRINHRCINSYFSFIGFRMCVQCTYSSSFSLLRAIFTE
jgi:hypothetical protein